MRFLFFFRWFYHFIFRLLYCDWHFLMRLINPMRKLRDLPQDVHIVLDWEEVCGFSNLSAECCLCCCHKSFLCCCQEALKSFTRSATCFLQWEQSTASFPQEVLLMLQFIMLDFSTFFKHYLCSPADLDLSLRAKNSIRLDSLELGIPTKCPLQRTCCLMTIAATLVLW